MRARNKIINQTMPPEEEEFQIVEVQPINQEQQVSQLNFHRDVKRRHTDTRLIFSNKY